MVQAALFYRAVQVVLSWSCANKFRGEYFWAWLCHLLSWVTTVARERLVLTVYSGRRVGSSIYVDRLGSFSL